MFKLEALNAKEGDALLLHYGTPDDPKVILIDGGPRGVYNATLKERLIQLRNDQDLETDEPLPIRLVIVTHMDDDHIRGVLDLTGQLVQLDDDGRPQPFELEELWHNSFNDIIGDEALPQATAPAAVAARSGAAIENVNQGRNLRNDANRLQLNVNTSFPGGIVTSQNQPESDFDEDGLKLTVVGPNSSQLEKLGKKWDKEIKRLGFAVTASVTAEDAKYWDESVFNLSSIVVLAQVGDKTMLLTGDARSDQILDALEEAGLLTDGVLKVDLLKIPHHGSLANVDEEFFRTVLADYYVFSGNGKHDNPEIDVFKMLFAARGKEGYKIVLTNDEDRLHPVLQGADVLSRPQDDLSITVDLS